MSKKGKADSGCVDIPTDIPTGFSTRFKVDFGKRNRKTVKDLLVEMGFAKRDGAVDPKLLDLLNTVVQCLAENAKRASAPLKDPAFILKKTHDLSRMEMLAKMPKQKRKKVKK